MIQYKNIIFQIHVKIPGIMGSISTYRIVIFSHLYAPKYVIKGTHFILSYALNFLLQKRATVKYQKGIFLRFI